MIRFLELVVLRLILWIGLPLLLAVLLLGPKRVSGWLKHAWRWLRERRQAPEEILADVVRRHEEHVQALRRALVQAEAAESAIARNKHESEKNVRGLEAEAHDQAARGDELGARGALYKLNLERVAAESFQEQLERQRRHIVESRRRLYLLELQLRQYEVGRSILLSQLAEAKTVQQQYAIANEFDPFSAVANWARAEGMVEEKALTARAAERVHADTADLALGRNVDPIVLVAQLAELKARLRPAGDRTKQSRTDHSAPEEDHDQPTDGRQRDAH